MSKELYDLCRRYKHFYNKQKDVESWSRKYHDLDLSKAIGIADAQLREATHNLQIGLFKEFGVECMSMNTMHDIEPLISGFGNGFGVNCHGNSSSVEFRNSNMFLYCLTKYMHDFGKNR